VLVATAIVADLERGWVDERNAATLTITGLHVRARGTKGCEEESHEALITHSLRKLAAQMPKNVDHVVGLEIMKRT